MTTPIADSPGRPALRAAPGRRTSARPTASWSAESGRAGCWPRSRPGSARRTGTTRSRRSSRAPRPRRRRTRTPGESAHRRCPRAGRAARTRRPPVTVCTAREISTDSGGRHRCCSTVPDASESIPTNGRTYAHHGASPAPRSPLTTSSDTAEPQTQAEQLRHSRALGQHERGQDDHHQGLHRRDQRRRPGRHAQAHPADREAEVGHLAQQPEHDLAAEAGAS